MHVYIKSESISETMST